MKLKIGVMGSAGGEFKRKHLRLAYKLGQAIAEADCICITGACPGLPFEASRGAKNKGGLVIGISPALSIDEHMFKYRSPIEYNDVLIFTGSGLMGREITTIRTCDIVVILGGRTGTLGEFAIAYDEGKLIGVLTGTGGIADQIDTIEKIIDKDTGAKVIYDPDPKKLIERLLNAFKTEHFKKPSIFSEYRETYDGLWDF